MNAWTLALSNLGGCLPTHIKPPSTIYSAEEREAQGELLLAALGRKEYGTTELARLTGMNADITERRLSALLLAGRITRRVVTQSAAPRRKALWSRA